MRALEQLLNEAAALGSGGAPAGKATAAETEVARALQICNACRYCEGFCAVFPAMTRRLEFPPADVHYLANLCHQCGACLHACQYAPPHEFALNVPRAMAQVRLQTYARYAWPRRLSALYAHAGLTLALALAGGLALFMMLALALNGTLWTQPSMSGFYGVLPHNTLVSLFAPVLLGAVLALSLGVRQFWRGQSPGPATPAAVSEAAQNVLRLTYLGGGHGQGCNNADDAFSLQRRRFHHFTFYGFLLCFAATAVATLDHYLWAQPAPYAWTSAPKLLGISGGVALLIGCTGLLWLNQRRHPLQQDPVQRPMDRGFTALLLLTAASGLVLMALRGSPALALALCLHLGAVMALFATMPYGKFAHGIYRSAALLKWAIERRQPSTLKLGDD